MKQIIFILFFCTIITSCNKISNIKTIDIENEKQIIEKTIRNSITWAENKDTSLLYSIIANDANFLEVHPDNSIVTGINEFKKAEKFWLDPRFKAIKCEIWDLKISLSQDGSVAWFYCMLNDIAEWDGQPTGWENTRWTGVLEKREGRWQTVQQHFSFANK